MTMQDRCATVPRFDHQPKCLPALRKGLSLCTLALALALPATVRADVAVHIDGGSGGNAAANSAHGWEFTVSETMTVTHLGLWDQDGNGFAASHPIGLFRVSDSALLATGTMSAGTGDPIDDGFRYIEVAPVTLDPNVNYVVSYYSAVSSDMVITNPIGEVFAPQVAWVRSRWQTDTGGLVIPSNFTSDDRYGPNFKFDLGGGGYRLRVSGECPGQLRVEWSNATPGRQQGLVFGTSQGSTTIPSGPCQGTVLGLQGNVRLVNTFSTGNGAGAISGNAGTGACGAFLQLVESGTCNTTNVAAIP